MSSHHQAQQSTLSDVLHDNRQAERDRVLAQYDGAVYGQSDGNRENRADAGCCRSCGEEVSEVVEGSNDAHVKRVFGDSQGRVPCCPECSDADSVSAAVKSMDKTTDQARYRSRVVFFRRDQDE